jgi:hypothetical protein
MNVAQPNPAGTLRMATAASRAELSRRAKSGRAQRLAPGIYADGASLPPVQVARQHLLEIVATVWPEAVLCGRTALSGGQPEDGLLFVAQPELKRTSALALPGVTVVPVVGPGALPGDMPLPYSLSLSGPARSLIENVDLRGRRPAFRAGTEAVEDYIDAQARSGGATGIQRTLDQLDVIAGSFDPSAIQAVRTRLLAVLGSPSEGPIGIRSSRLGARLAGQPFDQHRLELIEGLIGVLEARAPRPVAMVGPAEAWSWLLFFESYFSNFIEGTEFGVEEARRIAVDGEVPADRPADAHDVAATYRLAADPTDQMRTPRSGDQLVEILSDRHRVLMAARTEKRPGEFKVKPNYAGGYQFVLPELVEGTLTRGFGLIDTVTDPFGRAVAMMALVTECHPFDDGNGRVARLTSNAELSVAGQVRIVIPTVYRNNYLAALSGMSGGAGKGQALVAVLEYAQRWAAAVDWQDYEGSLDTLTASNAFLDPGVAEVNGKRLVMPLVP